MLITPISNINLNHYNQYQTNNNYICKNQINPTFKGFGDNLEKISPLNYYMRKLFSKFTRISKIRKFGIDSELKKNLKIVELKTGKNTSVAWDINPDNSEKYIIFYHGLGQNITANQEFYKTMIKKGYGVFAPEYGGFGDSTGAVTAKSIKQNTESAINYLKSKGIKPDNIGVVGFSLGSFPAITMADKNDKLRFLVLISPFNSIKNETEMLLNGQTLKLPKIVKYMLSKCPFLVNLIDATFQTLRKLKNLKLPIYFIHSKNDNIIPTKSTKEMAEHSKNLKEFILLETGGHSIGPGKINAFNNLSGI